MKLHIGDANPAEYILIRHGRTRGNLEHRYIGCGTDEELCPEGAALLRENHYPDADCVFASPMRRCIQSAGILYPGKTVRIIPDLRECDFGDFEGRNYEELKDHPAYRAWMDSGGMLPFPGGESRKQFSQRCVKAFQMIIAGLSEGKYAFVVHGGTIMAIMEHFARPKGDYYDFQVRNGGGFILKADGGYEAL